MAWNEPLPTLTDSNAPTHTEINEYLENLEWLHAPPKTSFNLTDDSANITTVATTWAQISSDFNRTLVTVGASSLVLILFRVTAQNAQFDLRVNGTRRGSAPDTTGVGSTGIGGALSLPITYTMPCLLVLAAGTHTLVMEWKSISGTATIFTDHQSQFVAKVLV